MSIFDRFRKKKLEKRIKRKEIKEEEKKEKKVKPKPKKPAQKTEAIEVKKEEKPKKIISEARTKGPAKEVIGQAWRILKTPHVTEKTADLSGKNQYVFKVWLRTNKIEIKKAIEALYGVEVRSVKIIKVPRKQRRLGRISGWTKTEKKAIVKIKEGQKIELLPR